MTEAIRTEPGGSGLSRVLSAWHDPAARILNIDLLTVMIAVLLPWSTSGVAIAVVLFTAPLVLGAYVVLQRATWRVAMLYFGFVSSLLVLTLVAGMVGLAALPR